MSQIVCDENLLKVVRRQVSELKESSTAQGPDSDINFVEEAVKGLFPLATRSEVKSAAQWLSSCLFGLGSLEDLISEEAVDDICINGPGVVWIDRGGVLQATDISITSEELQLFIERIVAPLGLRADRLAPLVDARLGDGSRVHITMPPVAVDGPYVAIRCFRKRRLNVSDFCDLAMIDLVTSLVSDKKNIVVSGATGVGKTSFVAALAGWFGPNERIATIEDTAELDLFHDHVVRLETRVANSEGIGAVSMRELVRASLRLRPDRIVVGEVRGGEAFDMVQALNTGHNGCLATIHANSSLDALNRLVSLCMLADSALTVELATRLVSGAVHCVIHLIRNADGSRVVAEIMDVSEQTVMVRERQGPPVDNQEFWSLHDD